MLVKNFPFAKIIDPPHSCCLSRCWQHYRCPGAGCNKGPLYNVQCDHTTQCHRCGTFSGVMQLAWCQQECPQELLPVKWILIPLLHALSVLCSTVTNVISQGKTWQVSTNHAEAHLLSGWFITAKGRKINPLCAQRKCLQSFIATSGKLELKLKCCVYVFVECSLLTC